MNSHRNLQIPKKLAILYISDNVLLPGATGRISVGDHASVCLIKEELLGKGLFHHGIIGVFPGTMPSSENVDVVGDIGTAAFVSGIISSSLTENQFFVTVKGLCRVAIEKVHLRSPYVVASVKEVGNTLVDGDTGQNDELSLLIKDFKLLSEEFLEVQDNRSPLVRKLKTYLNSAPDGSLPDLLVSFLKTTFEEKLEVLKSVELMERFKKAFPLLMRQLEGQKQSTSKQIGDKKAGGRGKNLGKSSLLREIAKGMNLGKIFGDSGDDEDEMSKLEAKIREANMPENALKEALKEFKRLKKIPAHFPDHAPLRHYLEWMTDLPWSKRSEDNINIEQAKHDLDADHYGLQDLKKRIIEYLAVRKLKNTLKGPILCFAGPPGVGKTSVGKSIAKTMGRKFERISLGGVCDQSDIRGHRRTYIGSMPGRILTAIKDAGTKNPVILLDEIDKLSKGIHGDPAAALLEVLDPEQNHTFTDHYLNVPFDLSEVLFIATANSTNSIASPLYDRMEVIEVNGYTVEEKTVIASKYLVPKQLQSHGLPLSSIGFSDNTLKSIITNYTREAGVRSLERKIGAVCRVLAVEIASKEHDTKDEENTMVFVEPDRLESILGPHTYDSQVAHRLSIPGVSIGLAWTAMGGEIMFVEATKMGGDGSLALTGQLGDVMKESAQLALSWIRSRSVELGFTDEVYADLMENTDVHLHFPAGAVGKDGPSAGVAITTALVSLFSGRCVRSDTAMTGEITLRGLVLPVGGIKEKILAAHRASLKRVIIPSRNRKDLREIPDEVKVAMDIIFIEKIEDALMEAIEGGFRMALQQDLISKL